MEGFPESLRGHFRGVSEDIRKAFFRVRAPFWSCVQEPVEPKLELGPALYFGLQRALEPDLEPQAWLSFRCTLRKLALGHRELELLRSHPL